MWNPRASQEQEVSPDTHSCPHFQALPACPRAAEKESTTASHPTAMGEPEGQVPQATAASSPGHCSASPSFYGSTAADPPSGLARPPCPGETQELQELGCSRCLFASLGKSRTSGALSHIKSRRGSKGTSAKAHGSRDSGRLKGGGGGPMATAQFAPREGLSSQPSESHTATGARLPSGVAPAGGDWTKQ
jgi:hypothetical protein